MAMGGFGRALERYLAAQADPSGPPLSTPPAPNPQSPSAGLTPARALAQIAPSPSQPHMPALAQLPNRIQVDTQAQPRAGNPGLGKFAAGFGGYLGFNSAGAQGFPGAFAGLQDRRARLDAPEIARQQSAIGAGLEAHLSPQERALFRAAPETFLKQYGERFGRPDKVGQGEALFGPDSGGGVRALGGVSKPFAEGDSLFRHNPVDDSVDFIGQRAPSFEEQTGALSAQTGVFRAQEDARHNRASEGLQALGQQLQQDGQARITPDKLFGYGQQLADDFRQQAKPYLDAANTGALVRGYEPLFNSGNRDPNQEAAILMKVVGALQSGVLSDSDVRTGSGQTLSGSAGSLMAYVSGKGRLSEPQVRGLMRVGQIVEARARRQVVGYRDNAMAIASSAGIPHEYVFGIDPAVMMFGPEPGQTRNNAGSAPQKRALPLTDDQLLQALAEKGFQYSPPARAPEFDPRNLVFPRFGREPIRVRRRV